jgi:hypothetical protein
VIRFEFRPVEGAAKQIVAKLKGRSVEPTLPPFPDLWIRPEASAPASSKAAG